MQSVFVEGSHRTFTANGAIIANRRVKLTTGSTTKPCQVEYAGAGEACIGLSIANAATGELLTIRLLSADGTFLIKTSGGVTQGAALYGTASGCVDDSGSGTTQFQALDAATSGDEIECALYPAVSTTSATVSILDSGNYTTAATAEAALAEIYQNLFSVQAFIPVPLTSLREVGTGAVGAIAAAGGVLCSDTTPILAPINGATNACQNVLWAASNNDPVMFQVPLPPDFDSAADVVLHVRIKSAGTTNAVGFGVDTWWDEGDTKVVDATATNQTAVWLEKTATIALADVGASAQTLTCILTPVAHTTDIMYLSAVWLEYKRALLTA